MSDFCPRDDPFVVLGEARTSAYLGAPSGFQACFWNALLQKTKKLYKTQFSCGTRRLKNVLLKDSTKAVEGSNFQRTDWTAVIYLPFCVVVMGQDQIQGFDVGLSPQCLGVFCPSPSGLTAIFSVLLFIFISGRQHLKSISVMSHETCTPNLLFEEILELLV